MTLPATLPALIHLAARLVERDPDPAPELRSTANNTGRDGGDEMTEDEG